MPSDETSLPPERTCRLALITESPNGQIIADVLCSVPVSRRALLHDSLVNWLADDDIVLKPRKTRSNVYAGGGPAGRPPKTVEVVSVDRNAYRYEKTHLTEEQRTPGYNFLSLGSLSDALGLKGPGGLSNAFHLARKEDRDTITIRGVRLRMREAPRM